MPGRVALTRAGRAAAPRCLQGNRTEFASARCSRPRRGWWPGRQQSPVSRSLCKLTNTLTIFQCGIYAIFSLFLSRPARCDTQYIQAGGARRCTGFLLLLTAVDNKVWSALPPPTGLDCTLLPRAPCLQVRIIMRFQWDRAITYIR